MRMVGLWGSLTDLNEQIDEVTGNAYSLLQQYAHLSLELPCSLRLERNWPSRMRKCSILDVSRDISDMNRTCPTPLITLL